MKDESVQSTIVPKTTQPNDEGDEEVRIAIVGSRNWTDRGNVMRVISYLNAITHEGLKTNLKIVSGGAKKGPDKWAETESKEYGLPFEDIRPKHETDPQTPHNDRHYHARNQKIAEYSDLVIAFWDGKSPGTKSTIDKCRKTGTPVLIFNPTTPAKSKKNPEKTGQKPP